MTSASNLGKFIVGAVVGGVVGAAFGMLLAPRSGAETREMIREELDNQMRGAGDALREKSDIIKGKADVLKNKMAEVASDLEDAGRRALSRFSEKSEVT